MFDIQEELKKLPGKPGVYIMHDAKDTIIYVGKAVSLKNRVRQYFQSSRNLGIKKEQMVQQIARFEYIITDSELEALVLKCNLIKEHRPKYNTMLKDDKTYPYLKVTVNEEYPRVLFVRQMKKDKAKYFGPYTSSNAVKDSMELIRKLYTTVNFEQYAAEGGGSYTGGINRLLGQALWKPTWEGKTYRKGGFGSYHIEYEYYLSGKSGFYPWTRQAINAVHRSENEEEVPNE